MAVITEINSFAKRKGFKVGDNIISFNGYPMQDILDYIYYESQSNFVVQLERKNKIKTIKVKKDEDMPLGLDFDLQIEPIRCKNSCQFCFVNQLPKGLRDTLYIKDDDYRLSFISGCYITLTNVTDEDIERIIRLRLSPLYISVHAFDDDIRLKLVKNPQTLKLMDNMKKLGNAGIKMHTQLVVVPNINDNKVMEQSILELSKIEGVLSCAVVPVGLTKYRDNLDKLDSVDVDNAIETIKIVEALHIKLDGFCWCSDEYYVKANIDVREFSYYGDFQQIENGVGLLADFESNFDYALSTQKKANIGKTIGFITGVSFANILSKYTIQLEECLGIKTKIFGIENDFFGHSVTVAGLVTAGDIINQVKDNHLDLVVVPNNMLKEFSDVFLDNISTKELEEKLNAPIRVVLHNGSDLPQVIAEYFGE